MTQVTEGWILLGVNLLFFAGNVAAAEWILRRKRHEAVPSADRLIADRLFNTAATALFHVHRYRNAILEAAARLERGDDSVYSIAEQLRAVAVELPGKPPES